MNNLGNYSQITQVISSENIKIGFSSVDIVSINNLLKDGWVIVDIKHIVSKDVYNNTVFNAVSILGLPRKNKEKIKEI